MKSNGHDTSTAKVNGHGPVLSSRTALALHAPLDPGTAASDDARDFPAAAAACSAAAGKERDACAEVALPRGVRTMRRRNPPKNGAGSGTSRAPSEKKGTKGIKGRNAAEATPNAPTAPAGKDTVDIPPGSETLPDDGAGFVDAMHKHVDLYLACSRLVKSKDEKIAGRMAERLLEMKYGKGPSAVADDSPEIVLDIDSAVARRAAMGDNK